MFSRFPVTRLSRQYTVCPRPRNFSQRWLPTKPAPPVITILNYRSSSYDVLSTPTQQKSLLGLGFRQHEVGKVVEDPVVFQGVVDDAEKLPRQGDDGLAG